MVNVVITKRKFDTSTIRKIYLDDVAVGIIGTIADFVKAGVLVAPDDRPLIELESIIWGFIPHPDSSDQTMVEATSRQDLIELVAARYNKF